MFDDQNWCVWVIVSSGTTPSRQSRTQGRSVVVCVCGVLLPKLLSLEQQVSTDKHMSRCCVFWQCACNVVEYILCFVKHKMVGRNGLIIIGNNVSC